jgi:hypothetical protein
VKKRDRCRCPACEAVFRETVDREQLGGTAVDQQKRFVVICAWCLKQRGYSAAQYLERERVLGINHN